MAHRPRAGSGTWPLCGLRVERTDPLRFLAGCRKRRLNQALSVLSLSIGFLNVFRAVHWGHFSCCVVLCLFVFCLSVNLITLSVPVQVTDLKETQGRF